MPRDERERENPLERFRDPAWSESQASQVHAMQPVRSPDPDSEVSAYTAYLQKLNQERFRKILELTSTASLGEALAGYVLRMNMADHPHSYNSLCVYCAARRVASEILGKKESSDER
jgi:hypothetical protein